MQFILAVIINLQQNGYKCGRHLPTNITISIQFLFKAVWKPNQAKMKSFLIHAIVTFMLFEIPQQSDAQQACPPLVNPFEVTCDVRVTSTLRPPGSMFPPNIIPDDELITCITDCRICHGDQLDERNKPACIVNGQCTCLNYNAGTFRPTEYPPTLPSPE
ncbi:hypothetical protein Ocin01_15246 [Orchesella cincta]|uniref:Uncharacterized protein n=1 Tax=Orchesella cincta TaxID=48709 RepID=A0A1D2MEW7_ORCCI|nr:hypothetical protein Ocin01_15246 [Orchesella cincta]